MKKLLALLSITVAALAADVAPVITVDLYGNVFRDGQNTNQQIGDFARNNPALAPQVDGAIRDLVIAARAKIAADTKAAQDSAAATAKAAQDSAAAQIAAARKASDDAIAANAAELAAAKARVAELEAALAAEKADHAPAPGTP